MRVGVLALQGDVAEQELALRAVGAEPARVRGADDLSNVAGLIIPGGESTTIGRLAAEAGLVEPLRAFAALARPVWGICAGLILLARDSGYAQPQLGLLDVVVARNAFGRQVHSFEADVSIAGLDGGPYRGVFIRAPAVKGTGPGVEVLARVGDGTVVAVRQGNVLGTAFHPELTDDRRLHRYFLAMCESAVRFDHTPGIPTG